MDEKQPRFTPSDGEEPEKPDFEAGEVHLINRKSRFGTWLENVWYHYKVPIVIVLVLLVALTVCIVQCARRAPEPDYILCYAGEASLYPSADNTTAADMTASVEALIADHHLAGKGVSIHDYRIRQGDAADTALDTYNRTNIENLQSELQLATTYLFLLSEHTFDVYTAAQGGRYVLPVAEYLPADGTVETTPDGYGVYLRSTPAASLPGFRDLPEDTVLCLRIPYTALSHGSGAKQNFNRCEALFRLLLGTAAE